MAKILIDGGKPLSGTIKVSGAKNAALPIIAGVILSTKPVKLTNVPALNDVTTISKVLEALGVKVTRVSNNSYEFDASGKISEEAPYELVKTMRASFFVMGPLLARLKKARVPLPGGCAIGVRPVNIHLKGFEELGAKKEDIPKLVNVLCRGDGRDGTISGFVTLNEEDCTKIYEMMV